MKLSAAMTGITPSSSFAGEVSGDDYILALDCSETGNATSPADYDVATVHVSNYGAELSPETDSSQFYYEGYTSMKKSTIRKFKPVASGSWGMRSRILSARTRSSMARAALWCATMCIFVSSPAKVKRARC